MTISVLNCNPFFAQYLIFFDSYHFIHNFRQFSKIVHFTSIRYVSIYTQIFIWLDVCFSPHSQFALTVIPHLFKCSSILHTCVLVLRRLRVFHTFHGRFCPGGKDSAVTPHPVKRILSCSFQPCFGTAHSTDVVFIKNFFYFNLQWGYNLHIITYNNRTLHACRHVFVSSFLYLLLMFVLF